MSSQTLGFKLRYMLWEKNTAETRYCNRTRMRMVEHSRSSFIFSNYILSNPYFFFLLEERFLYSCQAILPDENRMMG